MIPFSLTSAFLVALSAQEVPTAPSNVPLTSAQHRSSHGGLQITGRLAFTGMTSGDTKDLMQEQISSKASVASGGGGISVLYVPDWYGFGCGAGWGTVDVTVEKSSGTAFLRQDLYLTAIAYKPVRKTVTENGAMSLIAAFDFGKTTWDSDDIFQDDFSLSGTFIRPRFGISMIRSAFIFGLDLGYEWNSMEDDIFGIPWDDQGVHFGMSIGFRGFTGG